MEGHILELSQGQIMRACSLATKAHKLAGKKQYTVDVGASADEVVLAFSGSWEVKDWYAEEPFGATKTDLDLFPYLRSIGNDEAALVNKAFLQRFETILSTSLKAEVANAVSKKKNIIFAGHSSGSPMAILTTLWFLEIYIRRVPNPISIQYRCLTFGSPLVGNHIFSHALNRQGWAQYFIHFVGRYDIVPRIMLAPLSSIEKELELFLNTLNPKNQKPTHTLSSPDAFFETVLRNTSSVASHTACQLMGSTNLLLETFSAFVKLSPYRPFGTYAFITGKGKIVVVKNPNAVLQILFYSLQPGEDVTGVARSCLHTDYESLLNFQQAPNVEYLYDLKGIPLSSDGSMSGQMTTTNTALNDLGLGARARLCLRAAEEVEEQKKKNKAKIDLNKEKIKKGLREIEQYQKTSEERKVGYYDAFKIQDNETDFRANIGRLELAGMWDEIIEMLKRDELPDEFETLTDWIALGTEFRRRVEPLDIANYYRHAKNEDTGKYLRDGGRPKRYKYTQRWREYAKQMESGSSSESTFWAMIEEMKRKPFEEVKKELKALEEEVCKWVHNGELGKDVFLEKSTFVQWWKTLPLGYKSETCLKEHLSKFIQ